MANHRITASATTRVFSVGIKTLYIPAPRPTALGASQADGRSSIAESIHVASGRPVKINWQMVPMTSEFEIQIHRMRPSDLGLTLAKTATVTAPLFSWTPAKVGIYTVWVRAKVNGTFTGWVKSDDPVINGDGASRGWLLNVFLAPVSGGGIG